MNKTITVITALIALTGCATVGVRNKNYASTIKCYSGDTVIFEGKSVGEIVGPWQNNQEWHFVDASTNKPVRISGACIIK